MCLLFGVVLRTWLPTDNNFPRFSENWSLPFPPLSYVSWHRKHSCHSNESPSHSHSIHKEFVQLKLVDVKSERLFPWLVYPLEVHWFCTSVSEHCVQGVLFLSWPLNLVMEYDSVQVDPDAQLLASLILLCILLQSTCTCRLKISLWNCTLSVLSFFSCWLTTVHKQLMAFGLATSSVPADYTGRTEWNW